MMQHDSIPQIPLLPSIWTSPSSMLDPNADMPSHQPPTFNFDLSTLSLDYIKADANSRDQHRTQRPSTIITLDAESDVSPRFLPEKYSINSTREKASMLYRKRRPSLTSRSQPGQYAELSEDDDYAWYFRNPQRYVWRPRRRRSRTVTNKRNEMLYGTCAADEGLINRRLFTAYFQENYGIVGLENVHQGPEVDARDDEGMSVDGYYYTTNRDSSVSETSTLFSLVDHPSSTSPTLANEPFDTAKASSDWRSSDTLIFSANRHGVSPSLLSIANREKNIDKRRRLFPIDAARTKDDKRMPPFLRQTSNKARGGARRRYSIIRFFSSGQ